MPYVTLVLAAVGGSILGTLAAFVARNVATGIGDDTPDNSMITDWVNDRAAMAEGKRRR